jgi:pimeloyl-ACP methyl ester carboxylesterase
MAHSAGAPYALSFANKVPERIRGDIFLLAPWVGGVEGGLCCLLVSRPTSSHSI